MKLALFPALAICLPLCAAQPEGPRHFLGTSQPLTAPSSAPRETIARQHLNSLAADLALSRADLDAVYLHKQYGTDHNGVTHIVFRQRFQGVAVLNAEWVVNIDRDGRILNAGGMLSQGPDARPLPDPTRASMAMRSAIRSVNPNLESSFHVIVSMHPARAANGVRFERGPLPFDIEGQPVWYPVNGQLRPAWNFFVADVDRIHRYSVTVDDASQEILKQQPRTFFQSAGHSGGLVFERESPQPIATPGVRVTTPPPVVDRTWQSFQGDPIASPLTWTNGNGTAGNNVIVGENLPGTGFVPPMPSWSLSGADFSYPLQLGPGTNPLDYHDAANTNLFYWINRAHDLHYRYGFDEQAGNFQADNMGRGGMGGDPMYAYTHYGAQALTAGSVENAFCSWQGSDTDDGVQAEVAMFLSDAPGAQGDFFTDGSYDAQVMVHEYTHGVSMRLAQQAYTTFQGSAMGEAWSDFYALEYTLPDGGPPDGIYPMGQYFDQSWGIGGARSRPYSTNMDLNPLTFANLGHVISGPEVHADGEIWVECLWEMRANLIAQFGETEGRDRARRLVMDGMKLSIPASSMVDMRDAILLANRVDYTGTSQDQIWTAFAKRGMGALAYSDGASTAHILASFDLPAPGGALKFYDNPVVAGETLRLIFQNPNYTEPTVAVQLTTTSGDFENIVLHQRGSIYVGSMSTGLAAVSRNDMYLELVPNDQITAVWNDSSGGSGAQTTLSIMLPYLLSSSANSFKFTGETKSTSTSTYQRVTLPFQFPYFDKHYETAFIYRNGLVAFDTPVITSLCTDDAGLQKYIALTPLWLNLNIVTTAAAAQPYEGIYTSRAGDDTSITFRWAAEYTPYLQSPVEVNFAATLYSDGRIVYNYGSGNQTKPTNGSVCGMQASGLSNGHDIYALTFAGSDYQMAKTITYSPPFNAISTPTGTITSPLPGQHIQDLLTITGTGSDSDTLRSADIFIDGLQRARVSLSGSTVTWANPMLNLASLGLQPGDHVVQVRLTNARGATADVPDGGVTFTVDPGHASMPVVSIGKPADGATVSGTMTVSGYAYNPDLRIAAVDTLIDGVTRGVTSYGVSRTDICKPLSNAPPNCPGVGFSGLFPTVEAFPPIANGTHTLQVRVRDVTGRLTMYPETPMTFTVNNPAIAPIVGVMEAPATNATLSGTTTISGYVYSPGHRITAAILIIDGISYGSVTLSQPRPDVCTNLPDANACPNIGFDIDFDSGRLLNGPHIVGIEAINELGDYVVFPSVVNGGINIFTQN